MARHRQKYGWVPDLPDHRDQLFAAPVRAAAMPPMVNLHPNVTEVFDQGDVGSCVGNAISTGMMMVLKKQGSKLITPSRLFLYYNGRKMEGSVNEDSGMQIRNGMKVAAQLGVCPEPEWPYKIEKFADEPKKECYISALGHQLQRYLRVIQTQQQIHGCLAAGFPVVVGLSLFSSFEDEIVSQTGNASLPKSDDFMLGGHAVTIIGINMGDEIKLPKGGVWPTRTVLIQNSWGPDWGMKQYPGCFTLPVEYVTDRQMASDLWTIRLVES